MFSIARAGFLCTVLAALPQVSLGQGMQAEEILKRIQAQREANQSAAEEERTRTLKFHNSTAQPDPAEGAAIIATRPGTESGPATPDTTVTLTAPDTDASPETPKTFTTTGPGSTTRPELTETAASDSLPVYSNEISIDLIVYFEFDSAILRPDARAQLDEVCTAFKTDTGSYTIIGHTDAAGSDEYNLRLSRARASEVVRYLVDTCGIEPGRLQALGLGEARLKDSADPRGAVNRRVEVQVTS
ncbi:MAG TPA: OmpA family protein [Paracoccaceae bacterium]|nr:OmpA family protein [Paracoccaceae bacterium]